MSEANNNRSQNLEPRIVRVQLEELRIYDVSESELDEIERGGPETIYLTFAVFFISTAISFTTTLATTEIQADRLHAGFLSFTIISYAGFLILGSLWFRNFRFKKNVIKRIRERCPPTGEALPMTNVK